MYQSFASQFDKFLAIAPPQTPLKAKRPEVHAYHKHPVLLLPSGPDKIWALKLHGFEPFTG